MIVKKSISITTEQVHPDHFSGTAWLERYVKDDGFGCNALKITFEPKARTNWHTHPIGQILIVTSGKGYVQKKGESAQLLLPGDVVIIYQDELHWHGATPDQNFTHIAIQLKGADGKDVDWLTPYEPVKDEEYNSI
jgi:4-carboxymuconolactone decarboxylase